MEWNVYYYNMNTQRITVYNIFEHGGFLKDVTKYLKKCTDTEDFAENLKKSLMYYFWSKSEYEIIISAWCGGNGKEATKVDIYSQVMLNWDTFVAYAWSFKRKPKQQSKEK